MGMAAGAQDGAALRHVAQEMKGDRELCMAAVAQIAGYAYDLRDAIAWMSDEMKHDEDIVVAAIQSYIIRYPEDKGNISELRSYPLKHVPEQMLQNSRVRAAAGI